MYSYSKQLSFRVTLIMVLGLLTALCFMASCFDALEHKILVVGATGTTGLRAIQGLLDVGYKPQQLKLVTRNAAKPNIEKMKRLGFGIVQADLEKQDTLRAICEGCTGCYIHSTASDTHELDLMEAERARNLCAAILQQSCIQKVVYNSAAGARDHGVARIQQKHDVEEAFQAAIENNESLLQFTSLRANLFMEELWKRYTRPQILAGKYPLPANRRRRIYLVSVRDLGRLAGTLLNEEKVHDKPFLIINVASDCLTGTEIAQAFARSQHSTCRYINPRWLTWKARWKHNGLYEQIKFLQTSKEVTDIEALRVQFPSLLTSFDEFLEETSWGNRTRTFEDFANPELLAGHT